MIPKSFFAAVHRGMFLSGAVQSLLVMVFWAADLGARKAGLWAEPAWSLPSYWLHGLVIIYGVFPFFIFGFILTAGPRWQGYEETPSVVFIPAFWLLSIGWLAVWTGVTIVPLLLVPGLIAILLGWLVVTRHLWRIANWPNQERRHIRLATVVVSLGAAGLILFATYAATAEPILARLAITIGLWGFVFPMFVLVTHRMLPFFSANAIPELGGYRPYWALWTIVVGAMGHGLLTFLEVPQWTWIVDLSVALTAFRLTLKWHLRKSLADKLLAVLHIGFAWCSVSFALFTFDSVLIFTGYTGLGLAPLHALTLGFLASMLVGMASRVTLGHSGLPLVANATMWRSFWIMQMAAVLRMAGEFIHLPAPWDLSFIASIFWLGAFLTWTVKYAPYTWRPRADGLPG
jgi:uncharacterized protein involved in response to NO